MEQSSDLRRKHHQLLTCPGTVMTTAGVAGYCTRQKRSYDISKISRFGLHCALYGDFSDPNQVIHASGAYDGKGRTVAITF
ncbi:MAG: hypothetical protein JRH20_25390 [Deltaproteobacteria bacterium]|nr:hypothetical protein [Deltaproteobacteria bacterium]